MPVEEQVVQIYASTSGYLDRISIDKVERFLAELVEMVRGRDAELLGLIAGGIGRNPRRLEWPRS